MLARLICVAFIVLVSSLQIANCEEIKDREYTKFLKCDLEKASLEKSNECPANSKCIDPGKTGAVYGWCICEKNYTVNEKSNDKNAAYCIVRDNSSTTTVSPPPPQPVTNPSTNKPPVVVASTTTTQLPQQPTKATQNPTLPPSTTTTLNSKTSSQPPSTPPSPQATTNAPAKVENVTAIPSSNETATTKQNKTAETNGAKPQAHHFLGGIMLPIMFVLAFAGVAYGIKKYDLIERAQTFVRNRRAVGQPHQTRYDGLENDFDDDPLLI